MDGTIEMNGKQYWWWAGPANDGAEERFCVHCRGENLGVTRYLDDEPKPERTEAENVAKKLVSKVEAIS